LISDAELLARDDGQRGRSRHFWTVVFPASFRLVAAKFRQFLDSRYMGECLRLYTELESFEFERREAAR
jgi:hypothetical protein